MAPTKSKGIPVPAGSNKKKLDILAFHNAVHAELKKSYVNFVLCTSFADEPKWASWNGKARFAQDSPWIWMSPTLKMNCASNSKVITAVAVLRVLAKTSKVSLDSKMHPFLPDHWDIGSAAKKITFRHLLGYSSGLAKLSKSSYAGLKGAVADGPSTTPGTTTQYKGTEYGLLRLILPRLMGMSSIEIASTLSSSLVAALEQAQDAELSIKFANCVQSLVFERCGIANATLMPTEATEMLRYESATTKKHGSSSWDSTLVAGSTGWHLSCIDLAKFYRTLWSTTVLLPKWLRDLMLAETLAYNGVGVEAGVAYAQKGGLSNGGGAAYRSQFVGFANGVTTVMYSNCPRVAGSTGALDAALAAFRDWYE